MKPRVAFGGQKRFDSLPCATEGAQASLKSVSLLILKIVQSKASGGDSTAGRILALQAWRHPTGPRSRGHSSCPGPAPGVRSTSAVSRGRSWDDFHKH